ncbi:MAG: HIT family protein [Anaeroplasmataceae bacterium]|nr:HIT family protein [Anaeroplasmataceae bacterium]MDE5868567.1 HIT family protein [Anaeroplasmataceae bacterium]
MNCIFCKIINKELPSYLIYEDEYTYAFLDIAKDVDGHTIVIPKKHVVNILDCDNETLAHVMDTVRLISKHYVEDLGFDGVNILNANNEAAEQSVFHLHFHIIPRKKEDGLHAWPNFEGAKHSLEEMVEYLKIHQ